MIVSFVEYCGQFQLTPSRRATLCVFPHRLPGVFQLTPSRRATILKQPPTVSATYFNSRPHGGRHLRSAGSEKCRRFQLTPSRRATPSFRRVSGSCSLFQLTPSRRATVCAPGLSSRVVFQLTPSRRATRAVFVLFEQFSYFNSRPHGGRHPPGFNCGECQYFNSRPHGGRRTNGGNPQGGDAFQLTPSRRATRGQHYEGIRCRISTHALTEGDTDSGRTTSDNNISTHALTEGDMIADYLNVGTESISTHALTEGDDDKQ